MKSKSEPATYPPDLAAEFACALSLWQECTKRQSENAQVNLSQCYNGMDEFMRTVMGIGALFEKWSCEHICFDELTDVWSYLLEDKFGEACLSYFEIGGLADFNEMDCLQVAIRMRIPIKFDDTLKIPIDIRAPRPANGAVFQAFRVQTVRDSIDGDDTVQYTSEDDAVDEAYGEPYFSLYGVNHDGLVEHIADRRTYSEVMSLVHKLGLGADFPALPRAYAGHQDSTDGPCVTP